MVYSIKLKLEFAVLNQLMTLANSSVSSVQNIHIQDHDQESPISPMDTKEKPEGCWTDYTPSPKTTGNPPRQNPSVKTRRSLIESNPDRSSTFIVHKPRRTNWVPPLDRNCVIKTTHIENVFDPIFTNPAACYQPHPRYPPHEGLGGIDDSPPVSPTLTGTTLDHSSTQRHKRRAPPPPHLDLSPPPVVPSGILCSSRRASQIGPTVPTANAAPAASVRAAAWLREA